jgi:gas vesicle protein
MNFVEKSLLIAALLLSGAHAAEHDAKTSVTGQQSGKGLHKVAAVQSAPSAGKKTRTAQGAKSNLAAEPRDAGKAEPAAKENQDGAAGDPSGASEQTVQLGGVRG